MGILLVDDDKSFLKLCSKKLEAQAYLDIHSTSNPEEAIEILREHDISCVVSDYEMPGMTGIELCSKLKEEFPETPFILQTSHSSEEVVQKAFEAGADEYLKKGIGSGQYKVLSKRINNLVGKANTENILSSVDKDGAELEQKHYRFLSQLIDLMPVSVYLKDEEGRLVMANRSFAELFGIENLDDMIGAMPWEIPTTEENQEEMHRTDRTVIEQNQTVEIPEQRINCQDNKEKIIKTTKTPFQPDSDKKFILGVSLDITDRKQRENFLEEILESSRKMAEAKEKKEIAAIAINTMEDALDLTFNAIHLFNKEKNTLDPYSFSDRSLELFGEIPSIDVEDSLAGKAFREKEFKFFENLEEEEGKQNPDSPIKSEFIIPMGEKGVIISGSTEKKAFSQVEIHSAKLLASVTEASMNRAEREELLRKREGELEKQNQRLNQFASILSHDLRSPLNVAQGYLDLAMDSKDEEDLEQVEKAHERIENIIDSMLTLAKHTEDVKKQRVDVKDVAKQSWKYADPGIGDKLKIQDDIYLETDPEKLRHILENLFSNSIEHSDMNVDVMIGSLEKGFYVEDDGPGIAEEEKDRVLEFGYSTDESTGFGLSIVEQVAELLGFQMEIKNGRNGGTRFEFERKELLETNG